MNPVESTPRIWIKPYYSALNGLRAVAILMVFVCHTSRYWGNSTAVGFTWTGVDIFFVLSGFLITGILYDSLDAPHYFRNFYVRRALRIFPVFYGLLLVLFLMAPLLNLHFQSGIMAWLFYVGNDTLPFTNLALHNPTVITMIHHGFTYKVLNIGALWSLCVEEQFYLVWPLVIWLARKRERIMRICVVVCCAVLAARCLIYVLAPTQMIHKNLIHWGTLTRCDTLLIGAWMALFLRGKPLSQAQIRKLSAALFWLPMFVLIIGCTAELRPYGVVFSPFIQTIGYTLIALAALGMLLRSLDETSRFSRLLQSRPLNGLGMISYGFYVFHDLPRDFWEHMAARHPQITFAIPFIMFASALLLAMLSFRFVETPFLRLKRILAPQWDGHKRGELAQPVSLHVPQPE